MSPTNAPPLHLPEFIDTRRVSAFQYGVIVLCGLAMFLDGFDTQAISYMAPHIADEWGLPPEALGPIFSSALVGLMIGYLALSPLSDRFGHKRLILIGTSVFALSTLAAIWVQGLTELIVLRFITGLGLGAVAPSAVALTAELSPKRLRATFVLVIYCGFSLGFVVAGLVAGPLIPAYGWRSMFCVGAAAPLVLVPLLAKFLPESPSFMVQHATDPAPIQRIVRRIDPKLPEQSAPAYTVDERQTGERVPLRSLFTQGQLLGTALLWLVFIINLGEFYALQSWLPTILTGLHYSTGVVVTATTLTTVGGIAAAVVIGPAMDRLGAYRTLAILYTVGFVFVAVTGLALHTTLWILLTANFLAGCCISGGQKSLIALAAVHYPAHVRSTGVGWALGIGRVGGILGPLIVGAALGLHWSPSTVFYAMAIPMLLAGLTIFLLGRRTSPSTSPRQPPHAEYTGHSHAEHPS